MTLKKWLSILVVCVLVTCLCGCSVNLPWSLSSQKSGGKEDVMLDPADGTQEAVPAPEEAEDTEAEQTADAAEDAEAEAPAESADGNDGEAEETAVVAADELEAEEMTEQPWETRPLKMRIGDRDMKVDWEENDAVLALKEMVAEEPFTIQMSLFGGFEQVGPLGKHFPAEDREITTEPGDIMLYAGNQFVVFYGENTWDYTRLGKITGMDADTLAALIGSEDAEITLYLSDRTDERVRIVCFGDSNTYGYDPSKQGDVPEEVRYDETVRWPAVLADKLGDGYVVIEAGYNGRTNIFDNGDPMRNGLEVIDETIEENKPVDVLIVMLGTNDCYMDEITAATEVRDGLQQVLEKAAQVSREKQGFAPDILIITPPGSETPKNEDGTPNIDENMDSTAIYRLQAGIQMTYQLAPLYEALAWDFGCYYLNGADLAVSPIDGVHLSPEGHADLAERVYDKLVNFMGE